MLSKNQHKLITSLNQKKYRQKHRLFIAEGPKVVNEILGSNIELEALFCTDDFNIRNNINFHTITDRELKQLSNLKTPNQVVAIFRIPEVKPSSNTGMVLALDGVNDPGNLGTIIRLCDWYGIEELRCSLDTVDCYNPKVVQASMGSLARVSVHYVDLVSYLSMSTLPKYGAAMQGENIRTFELENPGIIVMGNEANGLSEAVINLMDHLVSIPKFNPDAAVESLNVATATAILLHECRR
ncbi:RNA methyltransferase [Flavobacteriaceae bacterium F08102]|nr:RNA methyltransferase [Flavobacteriaceae bacterium F08102]